MTARDPREERAPAEWAKRAELIRFVQDQHIREALLFQLERDKEAHRLRIMQGQRAQAFRDEFDKFRTETQKREIANIDDHATIMCSLGRIESALEVLPILTARVDGIVVQLSGAEGELNFLGREVRELEKGESELRVKVGAVEAEAREERVKMAERAAELRARVVELTAAVGDAAKDGAVAKFVAREAFDSIVEKDGEAEETRKRGFEYRKLALWALLVLVLTGVGTALRVRYGAENVPQIPAPPAAAPH